MEASLTCAVCLSVFENPTTLPVCSHNFCKKCILECVTKSFSSGLGYSSSNNIWRNSQLECPLCRKSNFIAEGAVNLPGNTTLAEVVKLFKSQYGSGAAGATEDEKGEECAAAAAAGARGPGGGGGGGRAVCDRHPPRTLQLFCKICKQVACGQCVSEDHCGVFHAVNLVDMIYQEEKLDYFNNLRELRQLNDKLKIEIADTPSDNEHVLEYEKDVVEIKFDEILEKVELKRKQLLDEIEKQKEWKKTERKARLEGKRTQKDTVEKYLKECEGLVNECNPVNFLKVACDLNERIKSNLAIIIPTLKKHGELDCLQPSQFLIKPVLDSISALQLTKDTAKPISILDTGNTASKLCSDSYRFKTTLKMWKQPKDFTEAKFSEVRYKHYQSYRKDWNCFVTEKCPGNENGVEPSVSSGISTDLFKTPDGVQQPHIKLFSFGQSIKKVKKKFRGNGSSNLELRLPLDSGATTSTPSVSNSETSLSNSLKKLPNVGEKKQNLVPVPSLSVESETISSAASIVRSLGTTTATVSLPVTMSSCTTVTGFDKTGEHQQKSFSISSSGFMVSKCSGSMPTQKAFNNSNFSTALVNPTSTSGGSLSSVSSSAFTFGKVACSTLVTKTENQQPLPASTSFMIDKLNACSPTRNSTKTGNQQPLPASASFMIDKLNACPPTSNLTSNMTSTCDSSGKDVNHHNGQAKCIKSATANDKVLPDSIGTASTFPFGNVTEESSQESSPKASFKFGTLGPLCGQTKMASFSFFNPGTEKSVFSFNRTPNTKSATTSSESLRNRESLTSTTGSVVARDVSDLFTFAQVSSNDVPNENRFLSTVSRSTTASPVFKLEDPGIVTLASSLFVSPSSVSSSSSISCPWNVLPTRSSIKPLNLFTSSAETSPVFSRINSTGSNSVVFTAGFSQELSSAVSQQQSTVTPANVTKAKKTSNSEMSINAEPVFLRNRKSLTCTTGSVVARDIADPFAFAQLSSSDIPNLNENRFLSTVGRSTTASPVFKLEDPGIVMPASSLFVSPSSVSSSSLFLRPFARNFLPTQSSVKPLNLFTSSAETSPVFSRMNSTGSNSVAFTTDFSQELSSAVSQQQSTVTPAHVTKVKNSSNSEMSITAEPSKPNGTHSPGSNEDLPPAVSQQQSTDKTPTNIGVETCILKETSPLEMLLTTEPFVFHRTESASSNCVDFAAGFSKDLSAAAGQQQTSVAPIDVAVETCKTKEAATFEMSVSTRPPVIEIESVALLQPSDLTPALKNPLERFDDNTDKGGKELLAFNDQSSDVQESQFSESQGHSKVHQSSVATSDLCPVEHEDNPSDKEDPFLSPERRTNIEAPNLSSHGGDSVFVPQTIASTSCSFVEANDGSTKDIQKSATDHSLFSVPSAVFCPVFTFGADNDFQFKLGVSDQTNAAEREENNGDCKAVHKPVFPFPPPVNHPPAAIDGEDILFSNRAKLYCFDKTSLQWKERAFGEIRVLEHKTTKLLRLVMWNTANKCCANHWITTDLELKNAKASNHSWTWCALDYTEKKPIFLDLAIHFKLKEMAQVFKEVVEKVQSRTAMSRLAETNLCSLAENEKYDQDGDGSPASVIGASDLEQKGKSLQGVEEQEEEEKGGEDVVMLSEITPTPEQRALASKLCLPPTFFCYKNKPGYHSSDDEEENFETAVKKLDGQLYPNHTE
ncbi:uncharacterized protein [Heptranchias perlo]|uniref:uncharacterized protein isoform X2 n=1 Tax=Heptranchias perlo TaxID=212740 RepID=UPI003559A4B5